ncbi:MAG: sigma-70 family RNA polymerase sigma factor [Melioribacteraceae bacterium]|nr:sigma-70 family RNA polymerase sigma factor [Melioribacteraceae bacterium]MCF8353327.1 sigma-70 family RNA polymerase sigma factor [Melioribacteraceae bacterium]MCF8393191.1 sigma-70 family RNA polymerase sigma factor [Melioribacteraceae bacterium]MCF8419053.1 sigma-70 family RNA polymerase sigma factor [Melioribacteraceae bacterium]
MAQLKELSDIELMKRVAKYESDALYALYDRYTPLLFSLLKKILGDPAIAENALVEVFTIVWRKADRFDFRTENVYTWLVTLTRNRAVDTVRRERAEKGQTYYDDNYENKYVVPHLSPNLDALDLNTAMKIKPQVEKALAKLTDAQKYVLHLAYYEGYTLDQISRKLRIPLETVRNKTMKALYNLRDNLLSE